jgi:hypothetical protein
VSNDAVPFDDDTPEPGYRADRAPGTGSLKYLGRSRWQFWAQVRTAKICRRFTAGSEAEAQAVSDDLMATVRAKDDAHDRWVALSDDNTATGKPVPAAPGGEYDDVWELLTVPQQQAVARGDVSLEYLVELVTAATGAELCPSCCTRPVAGRYAAGFGLCDVCARKAMSEAFRDAIAALDAQREAAMLKQRLHRARISAGVPLPRAKPLGNTDHESEAARDADATVDEANVEERHGQEAAAQAGGQESPSDPTARCTGVRPS